ncbi:FA core complex associated protein 20 [Phyllostomus discolor]|uniref:FA core complex associated protein 20 n=1 Tax=Phyllostomus discolor TaxID=89673 RepID=A0A6J2LR06_9CHIR|nr:Fanconi anemia core complex-associated protein 20 [Phyllostomus discolor]KAF6108665.1 FA core complex associated protein 20 [Phyllostomus discolor]
MQAPRSSRLRLSRRQPPSRGGPPSPRPGSLQDGDGERARLWAGLLRAVSADLDEDGVPPPLPAFPGQEPSRCPERADSPEVFTVGSKTFSWTPFPPAPRGEGPGHSYRVLRGASGCPGSLARSPQARAAPEPSGALGSGAQPAVDRAQTLQSCPMCQVDFAPGLAQLDIDGHLAQCLAGSTEDVVW